MNRGTIRVSTPHKILFPRQPHCMQTIPELGLVLFLVGRDTTGSQSSPRRPPTPVLCFLRPRTRITEVTEAWPNERAEAGFSVSKTWPDSTFWKRIWVSRNLKWKYVDSCGKDMSGKSIQSWWKIWKIWLAELWWFFSFLPSPSRSFVAARLPKPAMSQCDDLFNARNKMET